MAPKKVLLVEGPDDMHVVGHLCAARGIGPLDAIVPSGGVDNLVSAFKVRLKESDIQVLGVLVDADTNLKSRWASICDILLMAGYRSVPNGPNPEGTILQAPEKTLLPRIGIWLMPNNQTSGILEDFLGLLISDGRELFDHAKSSLDGIPPTQRRFSDAARPKALIHTWLAWQAEPGKPNLASRSEPHLPQAS